MSDTITFGPMADTPDWVWRGWKVEGERGAVTFHLGATTGIEAHSRRPLHVGDEPIDCAFVDGCSYCDGSGLQGRALAARWAAAGEDDELIRVELERWYDSLPKPVQEIGGAE